jgi:hypothetical protein
MGECCDWTIAGFVLGGLAALVGLIGLIYDLINGNCQIGCPFS